MEPARSRAARAVMMAVVCSMAALPVAVGLRSAAAQPGPIGAVARVNPATEEHVIDVFPAPSREMRKALAKAKKALEEKRYSDAVEGLHLVINGPEEPTGSDDDDDFGEDFFIEVGEQGGHWTSIRAEARRLLGSMPPEGRREYQRWFGARARQMLDEALENGDAEKLEAVTRKFFHTRAGYQATMLLARYLLDRDCPLAAAICLKRIADSPAARADCEPELSILLAVCWGYAGMPSRVQDTLVDLKRRYGGAPVRIGDREEVDFFKDDSQASAWLMNLIGPLQRTDEAGADQWLLHRGNASRNARSIGSSPLSHERWQVDTPNDRADQQQVAQRLEEYIAQDLPTLPTLHPLVVRHPWPQSEGEAPHARFRDMVLARTARRLLAVDFRTGKRVWYYPPACHELDYREMSALGAAAQGAQSGLPATQLQRRTWENSPYGQISTDGERVFLVDGLDAGINVSGRVQFGPFGPMPQGAGVHNRLVALELARQGYFAWSVDGKTGTIEGAAEKHEKKLEGAFFLGPPLVSSGRLYVMAEVKEEVRLLVLDAKDGRLVWSQQLSRVDRSLTPDYRNRRLAGATPSLADGVLVCPTSTGAVVAVDLATRSLLWGHQYLKPVVNVQRAGFGMIVRPPSARNNMALGNRWADTTATIADDSVVVTPADADKLLCLGLLDGERRWERDRGDGLYVGCIHDGKVVVVGKSGLTAVDLHSGKDAWKAPLDPGDMPSGEGFYSDHFYYVATTGEQLLKIDLGTGKRVEVVETGGVLGNLICYKNSVISQGATLLSAFYQVDALRKIVPERLAENPDDIQALAWKADLLLHDGRRDEALGVLRRAYKSGAGDEMVKAEVKSLLVDTLLAALREDFSANESLAAEAEGLINQDQRGEYLRLVAVGLQRAGRLGEAFDAYLKLAGLERSPQEASAGDAAELVADRGDRRLRVRRDRWFQSRLSELFAAATPDERRSMRAAILARFDQAVQDESTAALGRLVSFFGTHPAADSARLHLAAGLIEAGRLLQAELLLGRLEDSTDAGVAAEAGARMARLLTAAGRPVEAAACYRRLADRFGDVECLEGKTGRQLLEQAGGDEALAGALAGAAPWPDGRVKANQTPAALPYTSYDRVYPSPIRSMQGEFPGGMSVRLDRQRHVILQDGLGREQLRVTLPSSPAMQYYSSNYTMSRVAANRHLLLLTLGYEVFAIDALRTRDRTGGDRILWQKNLQQVMTGMSVPRGYLPRKSVSDPWGGNRYVAIDQQGRPLGSNVGPLTDNGVCFQRLRQVVCVDPLDVERVYWTRDAVAPGSDLFGDGQILFVAPPGGGEASVYDMVDGHLRGHCTIPAKASRWTTIGRRILSWRSADGKVVVEMLDPWDPDADEPRKDPVVWSYQFSPGAKGFLVRYEEVGVLQRDGKFALISLADGSKKVDAVVEPEPSLGEIYVLRDSRRYLLVTNTLTGSTSSTRSVSGKTIQPLPGGYGPAGSYSPLVVGRVYAFDRRTGKAMWPVPAVVEYQGLPLAQPAELPVLTFLSYIRSTTRTNGRSTSTAATSILCLDKRDGRIVFEKGNAAAQIAVFHLQGDRGNKTVAVMLPTQTYTLTFSDDPRAPEPPAQTGSAASPRPAGSLKGTASSVQGGLSQGAAPPHNAAQARMKAMEDARKRIQQVQDKLKEEVKKLTEQQAKLKGDEKAKAQAQIKDKTKQIEAIEKMRKRMPEFNDPFGPKR